MMLVISPQIIPLASPPQIIPPASPPQNRRWYGTTIEFVRELKRPVTLTELKTHKEGALKDMQLLRMPRLSVQVTPPARNTILECFNRQPTCPLPLACECR